VGCAFPINLSRNEEAAHYTPKLDDEIEIAEKDLLKIDFGVHVNGWIADASFSIDFSGEQGKLVEASEQALKNALSIIKPGLEIRKIGFEIEQTIKKFGFQPVKNLSGHLMAPYQVHSGLSIPNYDNNDVRVLEPGMLIAIEPFATDGAGFIHETNQTEIFQLNEAKPTRNQLARKFIEQAQKFNGLPFAERWIAKNTGKLDRLMAFKELTERKIFEAHSVLSENKGCLVSQTETTVLITEKDFIETVK